ncbi:MAG TPA: DUF4367 domain-containing protein [Paenibacillaceae bacterium]|nr:DUF4367 domain-containing protein [Paenibacillaceae bacterium]
MFVKRFLPILIAIFLLATLAIGCTTKSPDRVIGDLSKNVSKLTSYKAVGTMTFQTGKAPQEYDLEVWYKKPGLYRISLKSKQQNITQIILRNNEGVFVLTPHLNKSFRFQSNWPQNQSQVYLYESLIKDIETDAARTYERVNEQYEFTVKANYPNQSLTTQKIIFDKALKPKKVEIMDSNKNSMVQVNFAQFEFDFTFDKDAFEKDRNMQSALFDSIPTFGTLEEQKNNQNFTVVRPSYIPKGNKLHNVQQSKGEDGEQIVLEYGGKYPFKLIENKPRAAEVILPAGEPVDLGYTVGILSNDTSEKQTLTWTHNGIEYHLSGSIPVNEMMDIARSTLSKSEYK